MSNAQHLAATGEWYTNPTALVPVRHVFYRGGIDLDPFSSAKANTIVMAAKFWTSIDFPLLRTWAGHRNVFVNPPGTCEIVNGRYVGCDRPLHMHGKKQRCTCKLPKAILEKCVYEASHSFMDLVYLAYSVNQLRHLSNIEIPDNLRLSIAVPPKRISYLDSETLKPVGGTPCDSAFICMSSSNITHERFKDAFEKDGALVYVR